MTFKTANGKEIDMERLILKNEKVRAVGNMNVNAKGDVISTDGTTVSARAAQVNKGYRKQTSDAVSEAPAVTDKKEVPVIVGLDEPVTKVKKAKPKKESNGGLADAIAKVRKSEDS